MVRLTLELNDLEAMELCVWIKNRFMVGTSLVKELQDEEGSKYVFCFEKNDSGGVRVRIPKEYQLIGGGRTIVFKEESKLFEIIRFSKEPSLYDEYEKQYFLKIKGFTKMFSNQLDLTYIEREVLKFLEAVRSIQCLPNIMFNDFLDKEDLMEALIIYIAYRCYWGYKRMDIPKNNVHSVIKSKLEAYGYTENDYFININETIPKEIQKNTAIETLMKWIFNEFENEPDYWSDEEAGYVVNKLTLRSLKKTLVGAVYKFAKAN